MAHSPFRFLHASDLHLERPLYGVAEAPSHLRELFTEAPYRAASRLFDLALAEQADFMILSGDVLDATLSGPRGPIFLIEQFKRLAERGINVYWAGGEAERRGPWPAELLLPRNVHCFPADRVEHVVPQRAGMPLCNLLGQAGGQPNVATGGFRPVANGLPNIAITHGKADVRSIKSSEIAYSALGGKHRATSHNLPRTLVHYPGTPQGRQPAETGMHGCTLVEIDATGDVSTRQLPCDVLRWHTLEVRVDEHTQRDQLYELLRERAKELIAAEGKTDLLISWQILGSGPIYRALRRGSLSTELLHSLRVDVGAASPAAWSVAITTQPRATDEATLAEQETLLGDYLRQIRHLQATPQEPLDLAGCLERSAKELPTALWRVDQPAARQQVLQEAAALGLQLLQGDEA